MADDLERIVTFSPAWDRRDPDSTKNYGIHSVELRMVLRGPLGATQFLLYTGWNLPEVKAEQKNSHRTCDLFPMPADLGYHWPTPQYDGMDERDCDLLPGGKCFYDGSGLAAERVYERLLREGDVGVWAELESYYDELAQTPAPPIAAFYEALEATR